MPPHGAVGLPRSRGDRQRAGPHDAGSGVGSSGRSTRPIRPGAFGFAVLVVASKRGSDIARNMEPGIRTLRVHWQLRGRTVLRPFQRLSSAVQPAGCRTGDTLSCWCAATS